MRSAGQIVLRKGNRIEIGDRFNFSHSFVEFRSYYKTIIMSNDKLFNISSVYMLHCGINW